MFSTKVETAVSGFESGLSFSLYKPDIKRKYIYSAADRRRLRCARI
jgi:hypothetical protein